MFVLDHPGDSAKGSVGDMPRQRAAKLARGDLKGLSSYVVGMAFIRLLPASDTLGVMI